MNFSPPEPRAVVYSSPFIPPEWIAAHGWEIEVPPLGDATAPAAETRLEALMEAARARRKEHG